MNQGKSWGMPKEDPLPLRAKPSVKNVAPLEVSGFTRDSGDLRDPAIAAPFSESEGGRPPEPSGDGMNSQTSGSTAVPQSWDGNSFYSTSDARRDIPGAEDDDAMSSFQNDLVGGGHVDYYPPPDPPINSTDDSARVAPNAPAGAADDDAMSSYRSPPAPHDRKSPQPTGRSDAHSGKLDRQGNLSSLEDLRQSKKDHKVRSRAVVSEKEEKEGQGNDRDRHRNVKSRGGRGSSEGMRSEKTSSSGGGRRQKGESKGSSSSGKKKRDRSTHSSERYVIDMDGDIPDNDPNDKSHMRYPSDDVTVPPFQAAVDKNAAFFDFGKDDGEKGDKESGSGPPASGEAKENRKSFRNSYRGGKGTGGNRWIKSMNNEKGDPIGGGEGGGGGITTFHAHAIAAADQFLNPELDGPDGARSGGGAGSGGGATRGAEYAVLRDHRVFFTPLMFLVCGLMLVWEFSLQDFEAVPLAENPAYGPSVETLLEAGAKRTDLIVDEGEWYRLISAMFLHAGVVHYLFNMVGFLQIGFMVERVFGWWKVAVIYLTAGLFGTVASALFVPTQVMVGASGAIFGVFGALWADLFHNWGVYRDKCMALTMLTVLTAVNVILGLMPFLDNFAHIGGIIMGFLLGLVLLVQKREDDKGELVNKKCYQVTLQGLAVVAVPAVLIVFFALLYSGNDPSSWCEWCDRISCVEFPRGDSPWWRCDECSTTGFQAQYFGNGTTLITCPSGSAVYTNACPGTTLPDLTDCCLDVCF